MSSSTFSIRSTASDRELVFSSPHPDGFVVELRGSGVGAVREVNAYTDAAGLQRLLSRLAEHTRPWPGIETWESLEGEFKLSAECSLVGRVQISVLIRDMSGAPDEWQVTAMLTIDMGQLPAIAKRAKPFFDVCIAPNSALQRAAIGIKCSAAGGRAQSARERWRARVLGGHLAVAELGS